MTRLLGYVGLALITTTALAEARVTRLEINRQEPLAAGQAFGDVGAYEKVVGRFHGELDPAHPSTPRSSISTRRRATPAAWSSIPRISTSSSLST
jgi:hypothetical protein